MATSTIVWIVVAVIALPVVIAIAAVLARKQRERSRIAKSDEQVRRDSVDVERLKIHADKHFSHATDARNDLEERSSHADALDPRVKDTDDPDGAADRRGDAVPRNSPVGHNN